MKELRRIAQRKGIMIELQRQGAKHEVWCFGNTVLTIPRHREISQYTAEGLLKDAEEEPPCR